MTPGGLVFPTQTELDWRRDLVSWSPAKPYTWNIDWHMQGTGMCPPTDGLQDVVYLGRAVLLICKRKVLIRAENDQVNLED